MKSSDLLEMFAKGYTREDIEKIRKGDPEAEFGEKIFQAMEEVKKKNPEVFARLRDGLHDNTDVWCKGFYSGFVLGQEYREGSIDTTWLGIDNFRRTIWTMAGLDPFVDKKAIDLYFDEILPKEIYEDAVESAERHPGEFSCGLKIVSALSELAEEFRLTEE